MTATSNRKHSGLADEVLAALQCISCNGLLEEQGTELACVGCGGKNIGR